MYNIVLLSVFSFLVCLHPCQLLCCAVTDGTIKCSYTPGLADCMVLHSMSHSFLPCLTHFCNTSHSFACSQVGISDYNESAMCANGTL